MSELSPRSRQLLAVARRRMGPTPNDLLRTRTKLQAQLGPALKRQRARARIKRILGAVALGLLALLFVWATRERPDTPEEGLPTPAPYALTKVWYVDPRPPQLVPRLPPKRQSFAPKEEPKTEPTVPENEEPAPVESEWLLIQRAQQALQEHPDQALDYIEQHRQRFPLSELMEERLAVQAMALCRLNRLADAQLKQFELEARAPQSAYWDRIHQLCSNAPSSK